MFALIGQGLFVHGGLGLGSIFQIMAELPQNIDKIISFVFIIRENIFPY